MTAKYEVQIVDRMNGKESFISITASSRKEAKDKLLSMGEIVGSVKLVEILSEDSTSIDGFCKYVNTCPNCSGTVWSGGRSKWIWVIVIIFFPIGLLALFIEPEWKCIKCGYRYSSNTSPIGLENQSLSSQASDITGIGKPLLPQILRPLFLVFIVFLFLCFLYLLYLL